jgi:hypothetical protein
MGRCPASGTPGPSSATLSHSGVRSSWAASPGKQPVRGRLVELHQQVVERGDQLSQLDRQRRHRQRRQVDVLAPQQRALDHGQGGA